MILGKKIVYIVFLLALPNFGWTAEQGICRISYGISGVDRGQPVVWGKSYEMPELNLKFVDIDDGQPIIPETINIHYYWRWVVYPAIEHEWGAWSDGEDLIVCTPSGGDQISIPPFTVKPRGWYNGKYIKFPYTLTGSKLPYFDRIEIVFEVNRSAPRLIIKKDEIKKYTNTLVIVKLPDAGRAEVDFQRPNKIKHPEADD